MRIALDPGHNCPPDTGAVGFKREDELTLGVARLLTPLLEKAGHQVISVLPSRCSSVSQSLQARTFKANASGAQLYVSIHFNAYNGQAHGTEVFALSQRGQQFARSVLQEIVALGFENRGVKDGSHLFIVRNTSMPAILIEGCFVDSKEDMNRLNVEEMAKAIARGILAVAGGTMEGRNREPSPTTLRINRATILKQQPVQSAQITDPKAKFSVRAGQTLGIRKLGKQERGHFQVELLNPINNFRFWWVFAAHCTLLDGEQPLTDSGEVA